LVQPGKATVLEIGAIFQKLGKFERWMVVSGLKSCKLERKDRERRMIFEYTPQTDTLYIQFKNHKNVSGENLNNRVVAFYTDKNELSALKIAYSKNYPAHQPHPETDPIDPVLPPGQSSSIVKGP
jgi:hypothetical protein